MTRITFIVPFIAFVVFSYGQESKLYEEVESAFLRSKQENYYDKGRFMWSACNVDSSFYRSGTVHLFSNSSFPFNNKCYETAIIIFNSLTKGYITENVSSPEYGTSGSRIANKSDKFKFSISQSGNYVFITFLNSTKRKYKFQVISVKNLNEHGAKGTQLTLLRSG